MVGAHIAVLGKYEAGPQALATLGARTGLLPEKIAQERIVVKGILNPHHLLGRDIDHPVLVQAEYFAERVLYLHGARGFCFLPQRRLPDVPEEGCIIRPEA